MEEVTFKQKCEGMRGSYPCKEWEKSAVKRLQAKRTTSAEVVGQRKRLAHLRTEEVIVVQHGGQEKNLMKELGRNSGLIMQDLVHRTYEGL